SRPELKGRPVAVAGAPQNRHGIILAKSQAAKERGVKTAEAIWQAREKCPDLILLPPHYSKYIHYSQLARKIYNRYTDQLE
ncbi:MAG: DNA polymerase IV, partial [Eubacterium sp.]